MGKTSDSDTNCSVPQCKSRGTGEVKLYPFPKDEAQRKKWTDAMKIESNVTQNMQVCSRHFIKSDYIISDNAGTKVRKLKRMAVPSQNLPWQFPNKRVSPTLAKARMERLKNRSLHKVSEISESPTSTPQTPAKKSEPKKSESAKKLESSEIVEDSETVKSEVKNEDDEDLENTSGDVDSVRIDLEIVEEAGSEVSEAKKNDNNAGRAPTRLTQRKGVLKCEFCGRKCLTPQALQTHQRNAHKTVRNSLNNSKRDSSTTDKNKSSPKPSPIGLISVKSPENLLAKPPTLKPVLSLNTREVEKVLQEDSDYIPGSSDSDISVKEELIEKQNQRKTEFECPTCSRRFFAYFMAYKHMQKHHSGTPNGSKTTQLKPTRIEICTICNTVVDGHVHVCAGPLKFAMGFVCSGCEQEYKTLTMFDLHKSSMHSDGVESMFFSSLNDLEAWKQKMEDQTRVQYSMLDHNDTKKIYRCSHRTALGVDKHSPQRMCPSCVVVQEFTKGFQVHYYPNHYGHPHQKYNLSSAFKKYSITSLMNFTAQKLPDSDDEPLGPPDLYLQFQKITGTLVNEAARINVSGLKKLVRKALEMIEIVNSYVEDDDDDMLASNSVLKFDSNKDNLQEEVRTALSSLKRKSKTISEPPTQSEPKPTPVKRKKLQSTENTPVQRKEPIKIASPNSFIDSFQDFVGKTLTKTDEKKRHSDGKKTPVVKTKIGQFKPKTPPKKVSFSPTLVSVEKKKVKDIEYEVKEQENDCNILILKI